MNDFVFFDTVGAAAQTRRSLTYFPAIALVLVTLELVVCTVVLLTQPLEEGLVRTVALLWFVSLIGPMLIVRLSAHLGDRRLIRLVWVYAVKLILIFVLLIAAWLPTLDPRLWSFGYDPQRFYFGAQELRDAHFDKAAVPSVNYVGVFYLYGFEFVAFGHNAFAPALINALLTLFATLVLIRIAYRIRERKRSWDWMIGLAMIIPEVIWFDALTARDAVSMALITIGVLGTGAFIAIPSERRMSILAIAIGALFLLAVIRTLALLPAFGSLVVIYLSSRMSARRRLVTTIALLVALAMFAIGSSISERLGSYNFDYLHELNVTARAKETLEADEFQWSEHSIGKSLAQQTASSVLFLSPVRMIVYLVLPFPAVHVSWAELLSGEWSSWQYLCLAASALLYIALLPCAFAATVSLMRKRLPGTARIVIVPFWITLFAVAVGNQIIHERYRLLAVLLLWGTIWFGFQAPRRTLLAMYLSWVVILVAGTAAYFVQKYIA